MTGPETDAVVATTLDYFEGWFDGDEARMARSLHPALAKRSLGQLDDETSLLREATRDQMVEWTAGGNGKGEVPEGGRDIQVDVVEVYGNIATVVVRSAVYREYLHLARTADGWKIVNALWHLTRT